MTIHLSKSLEEHVLETCSIIAGSSPITAACLYGPWVCGYADERTALNVLLILERMALRVKTILETVDSAKVSILTVNRLDFERDVKRGWLGEFLSEKVTSPYKPLINRNYLRLNEVKTKKRIILELLDNLILEYPESSHEFLIKEEYFMHEIMMRRAKLFPSLCFSFLNMSRRNLRRKNLKSIMDGYLKALDELVRDKVVFYSDDYIRTTRKHIATIKRRKSKLPQFLKSIQKITLLPILSIYSKTFSSLIQDQRLFKENQRKGNADALISRLEDPKKYVFIPTPLGPVTLSDKSDIKDVIRKIVPDGELSNLRVKNIGGVLNDVSSLTVTMNGEEQDFVVKQFRNWSNLKWFSLALWSFGATSFAVLGQSRLENEYAINKLLQSKGFAVPKIFFISPQKRLILEEFIKGEELTEAIKRIISSDKTAEDVALVKEIGRKIAKVHILGVSLGDCKPENFIVTKEEIVLIDLEQATRDGNQAWDIAEFLYYSGHYSPLMSSTKAVTIIARNFIEGYLEAGGKKQIVKKAASAQYTKVFGVFTPPHVLFTISSICKEKGKERNKNLA